MAGNTHESSYTRLNNHSISLHLKGLYLMTAMIP
jgi:hypothetical protein